MPVAQSSSSNVPGIPQDNLAITSDQLSFNFGNLCGTPYTGGSVVFSSDGTSVYSPVSNRIMITDLAANRAATARPEMRSTADMIVPMPVNSTKFGKLVLSIDVDGYGLLFEAISGVVLNRINFKGRVKAAAFSHCGKYLATATGRRIKVWKSASVDTNWQFVLFRTFAGHLGDVSTIDWAPPQENQPDLLISGGEDSIIRIWSLNFEESSHSILNEHTQQIVGAFFYNDRDSVVAINRSGSIMTWDRKQGHEFEVKNKASISTPGIGYVTCCSFDHRSGLLCMGLSGGAFSLYEIISLNPVQSMSVGAAVTSVNVANGGDWIVIGVADAGQLIVWEWRAENFILKQQGHHDGVNCVAFCPISSSVQKNISNDLMDVFENSNQQGVAATFSAGGGLIATGGVEGKVKLWHSLTGFCFVTLADHTSSVDAICFTPQGNAVVSASMDGSIRAYDLLRYKNFRTYTAPDARVQFGSLAIDPSGDIIAAGSANGNYSIYLWSTRTGQCLDILAGHEARISNLRFSPGADGVLASTSWDSSMKIWNIYQSGKSGVAESLVNQREVSCCAFDPIDGSIAAVATLAGHITFWDTRNGTEVGSIDGIRDIGSGRRDDQKFSFSSLKGKRARRDGTGNNDLNLNQYFSSLSYGGASGRWLAAVSKNSVFVCIYDPLEKTLINRIELTRHFGLSGVKQFLNSKFDTVGAANDDYDELDQVEKRARGKAMAAALPGVERGDMQMMKSKRVWRTCGISISQDGQEIAVATSEGAYILSLGSGSTSALPVSIAAFNPLSLSEDISVKKMEKALEEGNFLLATIIALSLNEIEAFSQVFNSVQLCEIPQIVQLLPIPMFTSFLTNLCFLMHPIDGSKSVERCLEWVSQFIRLRFGDLQTVIHQSVTGRQIRAALCGILQHVQTTSLALGSLLRENHFMLSFLSGRNEIEDDEEEEEENHSSEIRYDQIEPALV